MKTLAMVLAGFCLCGSGVVAANDVAITYSLHPDAGAGELHRGRIAVQVTNVSGHALDDVSVRLALPGSHLAGAVLDAVDLAVGESVVLVGDYVFGPESADDAQQMPWQVAQRGLDDVIDEDIVPGVRQD